MSAPRVLIGISYCGTHNKGDEACADSEAVWVPPAEHALWLEEAVGLYHRLAMGLTRGSRVVVTASGLPSVLQVDAPGERDVLWRVMERVTVLHHPSNPGHQVGASICLRQGLECAGYWGYPYYLHTAEDVVPRPGALESLLAALDSSADYAGWCWSDYLNCAFFACRTAVLAGIFDMEGVRDHVGLEHYLKHLLRDRLQNRGTAGEGRYLTTHDHRQYQSWLSRLPDEEVAAVRTARDYNTFPPEW
jgi:hypothetical protein